VPAAGIVASESSAQTDVDDDMDVAALRLSCTRKKPAQFQDAASDPSDRKPKCLVGDVSVTTRETFEAAE
jgi:hypothetical protein